MKKVFQTLKSGIATISELYESNNHNFDHHHKQQEATYYKHSQSLSFCRTSHKDRGKSLPDNSYTFLAIIHRSL